MTSATPSRVLLLEDDERLRLVLARSLRHLGHQVYDTGTAEEARKLLGSTPVDAAVIDINLPDATGWDIVRWIGARNESQPRLIVISAAELSRARTSEFKPDATLIKPFSIESLAQHLSVPDNGTSEHARG